MQRIEDHIFAFIAAGVPRDDFAGRADHHLVDEPFHQYLAVSPLDRHRVVIGSVSNQGHRCHSRQTFLASLVRRRRQRQQHLFVLFEPLPDSGVMTA